MAFSFFVVAVVVVVLFSLFVCLFFFFCFLRRQEKPLRNSDLYTIVDFLKDPPMNVLKMSGSCFIFIFLCDIEVGRQR